VSQDSGVIPGAGSDMHDVFAGGWGSLVNEMRMQRRLPIVEVPFGQNADEIVGLQINRIGIGRRDVIPIPEPAHDRPRTRPEKILAADGAERGVEARIIDNARAGQNLFGVGRPDDFEFGLAVHETLSPYRGWC
jgi:hypothetical protein